MHRDWWKVKGAALLCCAGVVTVVTACGAPDSTAPAEEPAVETPAASAPASVSAGWAVTEGIETPESVYVDPDTGVIYSSQIAGAPDGRDGNGRIVRLRPDGTMDAADFVTGLNAPKGLRSHEGTLWVADLDEVLGISLATGEVTSRVTVEGAQFLNDVAVGPDGTVYVSDMLASRIFALSNGTVSVFAEGEELEYPNGLLVDGGRLIVGGWGKPNPDFSTSVPGRLFALDLASKTKTLITPEPFGNTDGLESDGRGGYIVSDWNAGTIRHVSASGESQLLRQFMPGTADIAFADGVLIVPHMQENRLEAYDIASLLP
ncbi:MAG: hypothetical protein HOP14_06570 [Acidobacteria bacterium]|nr:hypothetical protein [Acidobacteriota bacterium]